MSESEDIFRKEIERLSKEIGVEEEKETGSTVSNLYFQRAFVFFKLGEFEKTANDYKRVVRLNPSNDQFTKACSDYTVIIYDNPMDGNAFFFRGFTNVGLKKYDRAIIDFTKAIEYLEKTAEAFNSRGNAHIKRRDMKKAIFDYSEAVRQNPEYAIAYYNRGNAFANLREFEKSVSDYTEAIKLNPGNSFAFFNRGLANKELENLEAAIEDFSKVAELNQQFVPKENSKKANDRIVQMAKEEHAHIQLKKAFVDLEKLELEEREYENIVKIFKTFPEYVTIENIKKYFEVFVADSNLLGLKNKFVNFPSLFTELNNIMKTFNAEQPDFFLQIKVNQKNILKLLSDILLNAHFKILETCTDYRIIDLEKNIKKSILTNKLDVDHFYRFLYITPERFFFGELNNEGEVQDRSPNGEGVELFHVKTSFWGGVSYQKLFVGNYVNGKREGEGKVYDLNTKYKIFEGSFKNGIKEGKGMEFALFRDKIHGNQNLVSFIGLFDHGLKNGRGQYFDTSSTNSFRGVWKDNKLIESSKKRFERIIMVPYEDISRHLNADKIIGSGGYGDIYKIETNLISQLRKAKITEPCVAIKLFKLETLSISAETFEFTFLKSMFMRTMEQCARIEKYDHVLRILAAFIDYKKRRLGYITRLAKYSVSDYIKLQLRKGQIISLNDKMNFLAGTAKGMIELHKLNIMHRDLKWDNVLITFDNVAKITDFDTLREDSQNWKLNATRTFTRRVGTINFLAPEINEGKYGLAIDVYSFGLMIYALLYEQTNPFNGLSCCGISVNLMMDENSTESLYKHIVECNFRPPLLDGMAKYPRVMLDLMIACWDTDPLKRPSFFEIVDLFQYLQKSTTKNKKNINSNVTDCYTIITFRLGNEKIEKIEKRYLRSKFFVLPSCEKLKEWLFDWFKRSKRENIAEFELSHANFGNIHNDVDLGKVIMTEMKKNNMVLNVKIIPKEEKKKNSGEKKNKVKKKKEEIEGEDSDSEEIE